MAPTSNAPSYILRYFDIIGNGESIRLLLTAANVEWTEEHPEWPQEKPNQPFGRLPVLVEKSTDGSPDFVICESGNIERYLARTYGLLAANLRKSALQEQLRDQITDVNTAFVGFFRAISEEDKKARLEAFWELLDKFIAVYSKHIQDNGNTGYLFGNSLSFADITTYVLFKNVFIEFAKFKTDIADYAKPKLTPEIVKLISTVEAEPSISKIVFKSGNLSAAIKA
ncbi:hypothetical protein COEREDRAFT_78968 [Coemansia reversa NRRL 1564]|uniref:Glutathione S-transferase n=1 Tax=Coemansia reversa (strain ATCC 12441 / NRRL 1564) TaxID=763665 RepID=A0A2G5BKZ5_COERN|nr:hypothetical protein COEREDRAFT_78968 [Coemansia reversa NRRL 1564]|eukprot:PIA19661.1 hypothetical protein COEREDRAFT_78968 [Coemansia reversa NRRL 1564]